MVGGKVGVLVENWDEQMVGLMVDMTVAK